MLSLLVRIVKFLSKIYHSNSIKVDAAHHSKSLKVDAAHSNSIKVDAAHLLGGEGHRGRLMPVDAAHPLIG